MAVAGDAGRRRGACDAPRRAAPEGASLAARLAPSRGTSAVGENGTGGRWTGVSEAPPCPPSQFVHDSSIRHTRERKFPVGDPRPSPRGRGQLWLARAKGPPAERVHRGRCVLAAAYVRRKDSMALSSGLDSLDPDRPAPLPPRWAPLGRFGRGGARGDGYAGRNRQIRLGGVDGSRDTSESEALRAPPHPHCRRGPANHEGRSEQGQGFAQ